MESRMDRYQDKDKVKYNRTSRNANLYKEVYGNYKELDYFPIANNTNEIDMSKLREIVSENKESYTRSSDYSEEKLNNERKKEENRVYDINKILEKAKLQNNKVNKVVNDEINTNYSYLKTLETRHTYLGEMNKLKEEINKVEFEKKEKEVNNTDNFDDEKQYMTRELKFLDKQKEVDSNLKNADNLSPLDLFKDLKPNDDSFITEPVAEEEDNVLMTREEHHNKSIDSFDTEKNNDDSEDADIDVINEKTKEILRKTQELKLGEELEVDDDFYTSSYKFSKHDFDDEFDEPKNKKGVFKIILLILAIIIICILIYYFVKKYGFGI